MILQARVSNHSIGGGFFFNKKTSVNCHLVKCVNSEKKII